ncbi:alpha/beta hydrolase [Sandarakinorhabdus sp.]|uniref:alpha/beta fold hydrolase n=1 Tax=Sandarakinorhabdus sp. TaxID=1916663 RepID=UPI003341FEC2
MNRISISTPGGPVSALSGGHGPRLHFAHATGMNAQVYAQLLEPLTANFAVTASDARGHGLSGLDKDPAHLLSWNDFAHDLNALLDVIDGGARWILAGHSMGAAVSLLAAALRPERVAGLVLIDPALLPFEISRMVRAGAAIPNPMADQAVRRRGRFGSRAEARAAYHGRGVFRTWQDADLDAYLDGGLVEDADGAALACAPAYEAATFRAVSADIEPALAGVSCPFVLLAGEHGSTVQNAELAAFAAHPGCLRAERIAGTTHFLPLERPDAVRDAVAAVSQAA